MDVTIVLWFETMCWWSSQKISVLSIIAWSQTRLGLGRGQIRRVLSPRISYQSTIYAARCVLENIRGEVLRITNECGHVTHNQDIWHVSHVTSGNQNDPQNYRTLNQRNQWDIYCRDCIIFTLTWLRIYTLKPKNSKYPLFLNGPARINISRGINKKEESKVLHNIR